MNIPLEQFTPLVGTNFTIHTQAGLIDLQLIEATELPRHNRPEQFRTPLSLIFTGPLNIALQQDTYLVEHPALGQHQWYLVPILSDNPASNLHYQIVFG